MEVYVACFDHRPGGSRGRGVIELRRGERVEVLEEASNRHHREWWGVRRLSDQALGYVPAKCLRFDETIPVHLLNKDYERQKGVNLGQLDSMQQEDELPPPEEDFPDPPADVDIPEPDYVEEEYTNGSSDIPKIIQPKPESQNQRNGTEVGLISPKKLANPCLASTERLALHKELLTNQKRGINVLSRKSELRKALDKRQEERKKKEHELYMESKKTVFQKKLQEQASKLQEYEDQMKKSVKKKTDQGGTQEDAEDENLPEFLRVHSKIYKNMTPS